jgi:hypothetical protein
MELVETKGTGVAGIEGRSGDAAVRGDLTRHVALGIELLHRGVPARVDLAVWLLSGSKVALATFP